MKLIDKINEKYNSEFIPDLEKAIQQFKDGEIVSMSFWVKYKDSNVKFSRSHSHSPEEEAGKLLLMAIHRLGFEGEVPDK